MSDLNSAVVANLADRFKSHGARVRELADPLTDEQFWRKPFSFGNSFGHLVLHLTGNLSYYIGAQIAGSGYIRDRPREFSDANPPSKDEALRRFDDAVAIVVRTVKSQSREDWLRAYTAERTECATRLAIVMQCDGHMQLHVGQMIYLSYELRRQAS